MRYLIGNESGQAVYRICEIADFASTTVKPYKVEDQTVNQELELKHGSSSRRFPMDRISNGPFEEVRYNNH